LKGAGLLYSPQNWEKKEDPRGNLKDQQTPPLGRANLEENTYEGGDIGIPLERGKDFLLSHKYPKKKGEKRNRSLIAEGGETPPSIINMGGLREMTLGMVPTFKGASPGEKSNRRSIPRQSEVEEGRSTVTSFGGKKV